MALARWKDLCVDVSDVRLMAPFWAATLGLQIDYRDNGDARLHGSTPEQTVWINHVPEPLTAKQRVHLDVHTLSVGDLEQLGATRLSADGDFPWTVLADPEGGELCAFVRPEIADYRLYEIAVDVAEPIPIARWWAEVLDAHLVEDGGGFSYIDAIPGAPFGSMDFAPVPEPKTVKNRIHWDLTAPDTRPLLDAGATLLRPRDDEISWDVLADPEGNEFCVFSD
jgi:hypothetical protein